MDLGRRDLNGYLYPKKDTVKKDNNNHSDGKDLCARSALNQATLKILAQVTIT